MDKNNLLPRGLYRQIKSMNRAEMEKTLHQVYDMGAEDALKHAVVDLDMDKIRTEIGGVSGIGEKRLEQIMEIIQRNMNEADSNSSDSKTNT